MCSKIGQLFLFAVVLAVVVQEGLSIKCVQCNTENSEGKKCPADYPATDCGANYTFCRKIEQEINIDKEDTTRTIHQCGATPTKAENMNGKCLERTGTYRFKSWYCECDNSDGCNSAATATLSVLLSSVAVFVALARNL